MVVIGAGPAGEKAATHAAYFGKRVAVIERARMLGGVVINGGGVPTKTLRETALYVTGFRQRGIYGVTLELDRVRARAVMHERAASVTTLMEGRVRANFERHGVAVIAGSARLLGAGRVAVTGEGVERVLEAPVILLATGSQPVRPNGIQFHDPAIMDSDQIMRGLDDVRGLVVMGAGAIGCEYASIFTALGAQVTLTDLARRLVPMLDEEISSLLADSFEAMGIRLRLGMRVIGVARETQRIVVTLEGGERVTADRLLVAVGRRGNTGGLGLDIAGVDLDEHGLVKVDARFRTTAPGVYAAGDVIGPPTLASVAVEEGRRAASNAFDTPLHEGHNYQAPIGVYTLPEVGQIGLTEEAAKEQGIDYVAGRAQFSANSRANIAGITDGMVKIVCRRDDRRLLGVHVIGESAAEMVHIGQAILQLDGGVDYLIHATFNVPTWSEALKYAAFDALQQLEDVVPPWRAAS